MEELGKERNDKGRGLEERMRSREGKRVKRRRNEKRKISVGGCKGEEWRAKMTGAKDAMKAG